MYEHSKSKQAALDKEAQYFQEKRMENFYELMESIVSEDKLELVSKVMDSNNKFPILVKMSTWESDGSIDWGFGFNATNRDIRLFHLVDAPEVIFKFLYLWYGHTDFMRIKSSFEFIPRRGWVIKQDYATYKDIQAKNGKHFKFAIVIGMRKKKVLDLKESDFQLNDEAHFQYQIFNTMDMIYKKEREEYARQEDEAVRLRITMTE